MIILNFDPNMHNYYEPSSPKKTEHSHKLPSVSNTKDTVRNVSVGTKQSNSLDLEVKKSKKMPVLVTHKKKNASKKLATPKSTSKRKLSLNTMESEEILKPSSKSSTKVSSNSNKDKSLKTQSKSLNSKSRKKKRSLNSSKAIFMTPDIDNNDAKSVEIAQPSPNIVGLNSTKDQVRLIFNIVDTKRRRRWARQDCIIAMATSGIARKLVASVPSLVPLLYPRTIQQLLDRILKYSSASDSGVITFECLLQFVQSNAGETVNTTDGIISNVHKKSAPDNKLLSNVEEKSSQTQVKTKQNRKKKVVFFDADDSDVGSSKINSNSKVIWKLRRRRKRLVQFSVDERSEEFESTDSTFERQKIKRLPTPGALDDDVRTKIENSYDNHKDEQRYQSRKSKEKRQKPQRTVQLRDQYAIDSHRGYFDETHLANMSKHLKESKPFKNDNAVERNKHFKTKK